MAELIVKRYVNGIEVKKEDLKNIIIESDLMCEIIKDVNRRIQEYQETNKNKLMEDSLNPCI